MLVEKIIAGLPGDRCAAEDLLTTLVACGALITCLRSALTAVDPLAHLQDQLGAAGALAGQFAVHGPEEPAPVTPPAHAVTTTAVDLGLEGAFVLPEAVAHEAAAAANVLLRLSHARHGHPRWHDYHARFLDRFEVNDVRQ